MDSIKGELKVRLVKYFKKIFNVETDKATEESTATLQTDHRKCFTILRYVFFFRRLS